MYSQSIGQRRIKGLSVQPSGAELLIYDQITHQAFCLDAAAAAIWNHCDGKRSAAAIAEQVTRELAAPCSLEAVELTLDRLEVDGLLEPASRPVSSPLVSLGRRDLLIRLGAGATMLVPVIAAVVAPTAAQAYSGCVDCADSQSRSVVRTRENKKFAASQEEQAEQEKQATKTLPQF